MSPKRVGAITEAWYRWKALRLPWRRRFLIGFDLQGNTYWEFRLTRGAQESSERWRRIVSYPRSTHLSQVKVSPQWHQWLRHTRRDPPSMEEQQADVGRQARMKYLAAEADARWEAKPRVMEAPREEAPPLPRSRLVLETGVGEEVTTEKSEGQKKKKKMVDEGEEEEKKKENPWTKARAQGPSENWQPTSWTPTAGKKR